MSNGYEDLIKDVTYAAASMTAAIGRLAEFSRSESDVHGMIAVLDAVAGESGALTQLMHMFSEGGDWLTGFENDSADEAAELMADAAEYISGVRNVAKIITPLIRPLAD